jgi:hypothetical protein
MDLQTANHELDEGSDISTDAGARVLHEAVERMHLRDRERVSSGELADADLHFIPAAMARRSIVRWTDAAVCRFRR